MSEGALAFLHELERADEAVAVVLTELDALAGETERIGTRAVELESFFVTLPAERQRIAAEREAAEREAAEGRAALAAAEAELAAAGESDDRERLAAARRTEVRARDTLRMAERRASAVTDEAAALERESDAAERETVDLEARSHELARLLASRPQLAENG
ncbi:MAG: hypothetical protein KY396_02115, partial [Actinobacteria bacterium]|nr:hypothetical protein [Actinomycetota bacterium]